MVDCEQLVNSWFTSNTYILSIPEHTSIWLIDPGDYTSVSKWMKSYGKDSVEGILLTHTHFDHIYGVNDILEHFPECNIYIANDYGKENLFDSKKNGSRYAERPIVVKESANIRYYESKITLWTGVVVDIYLTTGHSDDSVCFILNNMLFTGDTLIKDTRTVTKLKGGSVKKLADSLRLIEGWKGKGLVVFPGHKGSFDLDLYDLDTAIYNKKTDILCNLYPRP